MNIDKIEEPVLQINLSIMEASCLKDVLFKQTKNYDVIRRICKEIFDFLNRENNKKNL